MNFWFKRSKIVLDCFTADEFSYNYCRVDKAVKFYPDWWLKLSLPDKNINMRSCRGFLSLYKESFILPFWSTLKMEISNDKIKRFNFTLAESNPWAVDPSKVAEAHGVDQYNGFVRPEDNYQHIKIKASWRIKTKSDINFFYSDPLWNRSNINAYSVLPGVVDFKINNDLHTNIMIQYKPYSQVLQFNPGDPMAMITPMTEKEVELRYHLVPPWIRVDTSSRFLPSKDVNLYTLKKNLNDKVEKNNTSACPFGFGKDKK